MGIPSIGIDRYAECSSHENHNVRLRRHLRL